MKIGFAGMGHLGVCHAVAAAARSMDVVCLVARHTFNMYLDNEKGLLVALDTRLVVQHLVTVIGGESLSGCDIVFITQEVDAPEEDEKKVAELIKVLHLALPQGISFVVVSQVSPGFTRHMVTACHGREFYYQLDPIITGQGFERCYEPERFVVGCMNDKSLYTLPEAYFKYLAQFHCPVYCMTYEEAEFSKIAINSMLAVQIAAANEFEAECRGIGAQWHRVVAALKTDSRIGPRAYLRPGIAGGHLPRDLARLKGKNLPLFVEASTDGH